MPSELDEVTRRVTQLEIEREALKKESDAASRHRLEFLQKELAELKGRADEMTAQWKAEKDSIEALKVVRREIELTKQRVAEAERDYKLEQAATLQYGRLPELQKQLAEQEKKIGQTGSKPRLLREEVTPEEIAEVVSRWTGVPVTKLIESEKQKLMNLDLHLHQRVVGQDEAVRAVAQAVLRARRAEGPAPARRRLPPRTYRRRQDRARERSPAALRQRGVDVGSTCRIQEKHTVAADRRAARLHRLRRGRPLTGPCAASRGRCPLRRDREGAPRVFNVLLQVFDDDRLADARAHRRASRTP